jgi:hypothetical protein
MSTWTEEELRAVGTATELRISTRRHTVPAGSDLGGTGRRRHLRALIQGTGGAWFHRASGQGTAHIHAADVDRDVTVSLTGIAARAEIDEAYRLKYGRYGRAYVQPMTADPAAATTLLLTPVILKGR